MFNALGEDRSKALLMFHSLTGCDTTTALLGIQKQTAFQKWIDTAANDSSILTAMTNLTYLNLSEMNFVDNPYNAGGP